MVERLLLLAVATSLVSAETELAMRNTRAAPNAPLGLLNLLPSSPQSKALNTCLQLITCQHDSAFNFHLMKIHHADLREQSVVACSHLCLRHRPGTQMVMVKLISSSERLVCGCGSKEALQTPPSLPSSATCSHPCPDGDGSCGGPTAVSVYQLDRNREECIEPQVTYHGCYLDEVGANVTAVTLEPWERWTGGCVARCGSPPSLEARLMKLVTSYDGVTQCECWLSERQLGPSAMQTGGCGWRCPDGAGWCGDLDRGMVSVYRAEDFTPYTTSSVPYPTSISHKLRPVFLHLLAPLILLPLWIV